MAERDSVMRYEVRRNGSDVTVRRTDTAEEFRLQATDAAGVDSIIDTVQRLNRALAADQCPDFDAEEASVELEAVLEEAESRYLTVNGLLIETTTQTVRMFLPEKGVEKLRLPGSIRAIGGGAFSACTGLKQLILPEGVEEIGDCAFEHCPNLTEIYIPSTVNHIGHGVFDGSEQARIWVHKGCFRHIWGYFRDECDLDFVFVEEEPEHLREAGCCE